MYGKRKVRWQTLKFLTKKEKPIAQERLCGVCLQVAVFGLDLALQWSSFCNKKALNGLASIKGQKQTHIYIVLDSSRNEKESLKMEIVIKIDRLDEILEVLKQLGGGCHCQSKHSAEE